jgi:UPF0716 protein FxsA
MKSVSYLLLFFAAVLAEVASIVIVSGALGWWTFALLIAGIALGMAILSGRGVAIVREVVTALRSGHSATAPLVDGALIAVAGLLFIVPGFLSDAAAIALLLPPLRTRARDRIVAWVRVRFRGATGTAQPGFDRDIIDVESSDAPPPPRPGLPN